MCLARAGYDIPSFGRGEGFVLPLFLLPSFFTDAFRRPVYLEAIYRKPKLLATILYAANAILLGFTAAGCIVFASNILTAAHVKVTNWNERGIAIGVIVYAALPSLPPLRFPPNPSPPPP